MKTVLCVCKTFRNTFNDDNRLYFLLENQRRVRKTFKRFSPLRICIPQSKCYHHVTTTIPSTILKCLAIFHVLHNLHCNKYLCRFKFIKHHHSLFFLSDNPHGPVSSKYTSALCSLRKDDGIF